MARVERVPAIAEIDLEPCAEIHRIGHRRHSDIAQITSAVPSRDVHAAAEGNCEMCVVAAHTFALGVPFIGSARRSCVRVPERDALVHVIADCLYAWPP